MFRSLIVECRSELGESEEPEVGPDTPKRMNKHDRAAAKVGHLLSLSPEHVGRKKALKMVPHMHHHFENGHGKGEGEYRTVDQDDLKDLSRHGEAYSVHAVSVKRSPGPHHHLAANLNKHVANCHDRMSKYFQDNGQDEEAELHSSECDKHRSLSKQHGKVASRHGYYSS